MRTALLVFALLAGTVAGAPAHAVPSAYRAIPALEPSGVRPAYDYYYHAYGRAAAFTSPMSSGTTTTARGITAATMWSLTDASAALRPPTVPAKSVHHTIALYLPLRYCVDGLRIHLTSKAVPCEIP